MWCNLWSTYSANAFVSTYLWSASMPLLTVPCERMPLPPVGSQRWQAPVPGPPPQPSIQAWVPPSGLPHPALPSRPPSAMAPPLRLESGRPQYHQPSWSALPPASSSSSISSNQGNTSGSYSSSSSTFLSQPQYSPIRNGHGRARTTTRRPLAPLVPMQRRGRLPREWKVAIGLIPNEVRQSKSLARSTSG